MTRLTQTLLDCSGTKRAGRAARHGRALLAALVLLLSAIAASPAAAQSPDELMFFRIGTASTAGTYFPVGGLIASAISKPPGGPSCERGGSCGVPGLIAAAVSSAGSVANVKAIAAGEIESALSQADVAYWAYTGTGIFKRDGPQDKLRAIANLFPETMHLVIQRNIFARDVSALKGKRISVGQEGSGTRVDALMVLEAFGLDETNTELVSARSSEAAMMLREGELDGFFFVAGTPARAVAELARDALINLVPITGEPAEKLAERVPFLAPITVRSGTYFNVGQTRTLSVGAQWLVGAQVAEETVYRITRALWHERSREVLTSGHPKGRLICLNTALDGLGVPLHPGAERYYREIGLLGADGRKAPPSLRLRRMLDERGCPEDLL